MKSNSCVFIGSNCDTTISKQFPPRIRGSDGWKSIVVLQDEDYKSADLWDYTFFHQYLTDSWVSDLNDPDVPWVQSASLLPHVCDFVFFILDTPQGNRLVSWQG